MNHSPFCWSVIFVVVLCVLPAIFIFLGTRGGTLSEREHAALEFDDTLIIFVTATSRSTTRLADITSLANTLRHEDNLYWVVLENETEVRSILQETINRSERPNTIISEGPGTEWQLRNRGLDYVRKNKEKVMRNYQKAVVYFGSEDYAYAVRFLDTFVKKVKKVGIWDVGRPYDRNTWTHEEKSGFRFFDLANFAVNVDLITGSEVVFNETCQLASVELCFLKDLKLQKKDIQHFKSSEYLIWHSPRDDPNALQGLKVADYVSE